MTQAPDTVPAGQLMIAGRRIVIRRGTRSQTVSVCTPANSVGAYETRYRLAIEEDLVLEELSQLESLAALDEWMAARNAALEGSRVAPEARLPPRIGTPDPDDVWLVAARAATERAITTLVAEFVEHPYLHRVEHSIHARLYELLKQQPELQGDARLRSGHMTQLVHKEWPETIARSVGDDRRPRGLFDLVVLAPQQLEGASLEQFRKGCIEPAIVIEMGLDYALGHLEQDAHKVAHSAVPAPYLVHLSRIAATPEPIEALITAPVAPCRTAYVHHDPRTGTVTWKHVGDREFQSRGEPASD